MKKIIIVILFFIIVLLSIVFVIVKDKTLNDKNINDKSYIISANTNIQNTLSDNTTVNTNKEVDLQQSHPYHISKLILYSSASAINRDKNFQNENWLLDIYQYTDIAIYLSARDTIKNLTITPPIFSYNQNNNISNNSKQKLYYLNPNNFGNGILNSDFEINQNLDYTILNLDNINNDNNYNLPIFFADCSNPITLKYTNMLLKNYSISNKEKIAFDGSLLLKTPIKIDNLISTISIGIQITNYMNQTYETNININIPLQDKNSSIYDGKILSEQNNINLPLKKISE